MEEEMGFDIDENGDIINHYSQEDIVDVTRSKNKEKQH